VLSFLGEEMWDCDFPLLFVDFFDMVLEEGRKESWVLFYIIMIKGTFMYLRISHYHGV
jgi:hypothetical protein